MKAKRRPRQRVAGTLPETVPLRYPVVERHDMMLERFKR
jgi:hypothetical protein